MHCDFEKEKSKKTMYHRLSYDLRNKRARSSSCETLMALAILDRLEGNHSVSDLILQRWREKRDDYQDHKLEGPYVLLDDVCRGLEGRTNGKNDDCPALDYAAARGRGTFGEFQRHGMHVTHTLQIVAELEAHNSPQLENAKYAALIAALNAGAWLDAFLWRAANQKTINLF